jgi:succinate-semialdehyde dehydrogenase / glutarate-semialdehyde dehydrogenase
VAVTNPATGAVLGTVPDYGGDGTRAAILAAEAAPPEWKARTHAERAKLLGQWHALIAANAEDLARILTLEQG